MSPLWFKWMHWRVDVLSMNQPAQIEATTEALPESPSTEDRLYSKVLQGVLVVGGLIMIALIWSINGPRGVLILLITMAAGSLVARTLNQSRTLSPLLKRLAFVGFLVACFVGTTLFRDTLYGLGPPGWVDDSLSGALVQRSCVDSERLFVIVEAHAKSTDKKSAFVLDKYAAQAVSDGGDAAFFADGQLMMAKTCVNSMERLLQADL